MPLLHSLASRSFYTSSVNFKLSSPPSYSILSPFPNPNPHSQYLPLYPRICRLLPEPSAVASASSASSDPNPKPSAKRHRRRPKSDQTPPDAPDGVPCSDGYPTTKPRKPRRGRRSGATAVEDFVRARLKDTFDSIRKQNSEVLEGKQEVLKERSGDEGDSERWDRGEGEELMVVDEDDPDWPLDADVGWGTRASEYFEKHAIKNVVDEGFEIDWESETDEGWVKEINCLEWESFAFHPSPLIVLVFERYRRAALNWELLKELEKAAKVYWSAKDRLPPRTIKIDLNIEKDLAHALNVKECPEILYLKGNTILYRDKDFRTADELVQMIAHFYYNAKRPSWVDASRVASPSLPF